MFVLLLSSKTFEAEASSCMETAKFFLFVILEAISSLDKVLSLSYNKVSLVISSLVFSFVPQPQHAFTR